MKTASTGITKMIHERTFADSNYKLYYDTARAPDFQHDLLHKMVSLYAARTNPDKDIDELGVDVKVFMEDIQDDAFANDKALQKDVGAVAEYLWTSGKKHPVVQNMELCNVLNAVIRDDVQAEVEAGAMIFRSINTRRVTRITDGATVDEQSYPPKGETWRGASFRAEAQHFYSNIKKGKYRVPGFLATSNDQSIAAGFATRAHPDHPRALWCIKFDKRGELQPGYRIQHMTYVSKSLVPGEQEYLFSPYSVFTLVSVKWSNTLRKPHEFVIEAALDNKKEDESLPLAPWY